MKIVAGNRGVGARDIGLSVPEFDDLRSRAGVFDQVTATLGGPTNLTGAERPQRFELLEVNQDRTFLRGEILYVQDEPEKPTSEERAHAIELHRQILALASAQQDLPEGEDSPLSYHLAGSLPLDLDFKQKLLGLRSEAKRIQTVIEYFEGILPNLRRAVQIRQKVGGNGHSH